MMNTDSRLRIELKPLFSDRSDAGRRLAGKLDKYQDNAVIFAVPRGGLPVAVEVADKMGAPLDIVIPRKIPIPQNPEAGYGAVSEDGSIFLNQPLVEQLGLTSQQIKEQAEEVQAEIRRHAVAFRDEFPPAPAAGKTALLIDDGLASGFTMIAAVKSLQQRRPAKIIVAVPVASRAAYDRIMPLVDDLVSLAVAYTPSFTVASFYEHWYDLTDKEVLAYRRPGGRSLSSRPYPR